MEPTRLLEDQLDEFERALLCSARVDEPDVHAIARAAVVLGVGATALSVAAGSAAASTVPAGTTAVGTFSKLGTLGVFKWLGIGVVGGLMTTSGVELARIATAPDQRDSASAVAAARPASKLSQARPASDLSPIPVPPAPADSGADSETAPPMATFADLPSPEQNRGTAGPAPRPEARSTSDRRPAGAAVAPGAGAAPQPTAVPTASFTLPAAGGEVEAPRVPSIADELAALERARRALATGNAGTALLELDSYEQNARARALSTEASVLRVEALLEAGQRSSAVALAQRLLAAQPNGPYANRLRSVVASSPYLLRGSSLENSVP